MKIRASNQVGAALAFAMLTGTALAAPTIADGASKALDIWRANLASGFRGIADHIQPLVLKDVPTSLYIVPITEETAEGDRVEYRLFDKDGLDAFAARRCEPVKAIKFEETT